MALTPKQEIFCQCIAKGMTQIDSYMTAYDCNSTGAANVESVKLMKRDDITARIAEIRKPIVNLIQNTVISERQQRIDFILERIEICKQKEDEQALIRWNDQLCKIYSLYRDTEQETTPQSTVNSLDISTLKRLSGVS